MLGKQKIFYVYILCIVFVNKRCTCMWKILSGNKTDSYKLAERQQ